MAKQTLPDPRADAAAELARVESERDKVLPGLRKQHADAETDCRVSLETFRMASKMRDDARRSLSRSRQSFTQRDKTARAVLVATADPRIAAFIDEVQYMISTRRNEFFGATPEGMQRWTLAIQRACDEARQLQCSPADDGKVTALLATWRSSIDAAERRIGERSGQPVSVGEELSKAVTAAVPVQRTKTKHGERYKAID